MLFFHPHRLRRYDQQYKQLTIRIDVSRGGLIRSIVNNDHTALYSLRLTSTRSTPPPQITIQNNNNNSNNNKQNKTK